MLLYNNIYYCIKNINYENYFRVKMKEAISNLESVTKKIQIKTRRKIIGVVRESYLRWASPRRRVGFPKMGILSKQPLLLFLLLHFIL